MILLFLCPKSISFITKTRSRYSRVSNVLKQVRIINQAKSNVGTIDLLTTKESGEKFEDKLYNLVSGLAVNVVSEPINKNKHNITQYNIPITSALNKIQENINILDNVAERTPQLTRLELFILSSAVFLSASSPVLFNLKIVEVLVPSLAAITASIGLSAEYAGKVAVAKSKEVSALAIQAAAEV